VALATGPNDEEEEEQRKWFRVLSAEFGGTSCGLYQLSLLE